MKKMEDWNQKIVDFYAHNELKFSRWVGGDEQLHQNDSNLIIGHTPSCNSTVRKLLSLMIEELVGYSNVFNIVQKIALGMRGEIVIEQLLITLQIN